MASSAVRVEKLHRHFHEGVNLLVNLNCLYEPDRTRGHEIGEADEHCTTGTKTMSCGAG
jgi:hypothetical protein